MDHLQSAIAEVHVAGEQYLLNKRQIAGCVAQQKSNREAISALKEGVQLRKLWLQRPGGVYLRLPPEQCAKVLLRDQEHLAKRLEELFAEQRRILGELEGLGVGPEYVTATA